MDKVSQFDEVKSRVSLEAYASSRLVPAARGGKYVCPACGSGGRPSPDSDSGFHIRNESFKCFSCGASGDVFDLAGIVEKTDDKRGQLEAVARWAGIPLDTGDTTAERPRREEAGEARPIPAMAMPWKYWDERNSEEEFVERSQEAIWESPEALDYLRGRGFTQDEIALFGFGWDAEHRRIVIPWDEESPWYHIDRSIDHDGDHKYHKPDSKDVGEQPPHNMAALSEPVVFMVEGMLDALAVEACEFPAIALCGTSYRKTVEAIAARGYKGTVAVMLDADERGQKAQGQTVEALEAAGIDAYPVRFGEFGSEKDACEALRARRIDFKDFLETKCTLALEDTKTRREEAYRASMEALRVIDPSVTVADIYELADEDVPVSTGLSGLDDALDGGLRRGLYVMGAISSMGKTTLTVQIADYIARSGRPVLFVTIEQSARELVCMSVSRMMGESDFKASSREIMSSERRGAWRGGMHGALLDACARYTEEIAPNLRILEGTNQPSVGQIGTVARAMSEHDGIPPVVFIDYLQLLAAPGERDSEKQATDKNIMALRQLSRDARTPVFVISSLNRASYSGCIGMDSFKESGAIEYGADVLLGLQPWRIAESIESVGESKKASEATRIVRETKALDERPCEVVILKQRAGRTPDRGIPLTFYPALSTFKDGCAATASMLRTGL